MYVGELRKALGETTQTPRFIATVRGRGYRFIAPVTRGGPAAVPAPVVSAAVSVAPVAPPLLVGREQELHRLQHWLAQALQGQVVSRHLPRVMRLAHSGSVS